MATVSTVTTTVTVAAVTIATTVLYRRETSNPPSWTPSVYSELKLCNIGICVKIVYCCFIHDSAFEWQDSDSFAITISVIAHKKQWI